MVNALQEFVEIITSGIQALGVNLGSGVNMFIDELFLKQGTEGLELSTFGGVVALFGGVGLAIGITTLVFNWIRSIGNR